MWTLVAFSIPEHNRAARDSLRKQLRWLGFAPLYDGLWVSPRDHAAEVIGQLAELGITTATAFRATPVPAAASSRSGPGTWTACACDTTASSPSQGAAGAAAAGRVPPAEALIARTRVMDEWRAFPELDPDLPAELLPAPGRGPPRASCSSPATTCSARWPRTGSGRSSPGTARNSPTGPPTTAPS